MLSLLKKSGAEKTAQQGIPWRPDFRDASTLPDTKTIRTSFFINVIAITVAGALLLYVGQRELAIRNLEVSLAGVEADIVATTPGSEKAKELYQRFRTEETKFGEAFAFVRDPFRLHDFVLHLGEILPPGVTVRRIEFRGLAQNLLVSGSVSGLDAAATDVASNFAKQLQADPGLAKHFSTISITSLGRNAEEASLNLELAFIFKTDAAPKGGAEK